MGLLPYDLQRVYWRYCHADLILSLELYLGKEQTRALQFHETLAIVVSQAFGDSKKTGKAPPADSKVSHTVADMQAGLERLFS